MKSPLLNLATLFTIVSLANADCVLHNTLKKPMKKPEKRTELCQTMGPGHWTFAMDISEVAVPTFNGDNPWGGLAGNKAFIVYDNDCIPRGVYSPDQGNDCGIPYWINDIARLPYDIKIEEVNMNMGGGDFTIAYANGEYMIGENGAICQDISDGLYAEMACGTAFPIHGEPK